MKPKTKRICDRIALVTPMVFLPINIALMATTHYLSAGIVLIIGIIIGTSFRVMAEISGE